MLHSCPESYLHPPIGVDTPRTYVNTHPQTVLPHWGYVYCSTGALDPQRRIIGISLPAGDPNILSVLVCLASVCTFLHILRQCFTVRLLTFHP